MKVVFIVAYFGHFPTYYQLFLDSCKYNPMFEWIIISDNKAPYIYPENVHLITMEFCECRRFIQSKFEFEISLETPQKLCDYKCAYGYIFQEYIKEYAWWGHCDLDQIFGNLSKFITKEQLMQYDKIGSLGHMTLYKNTVQNNLMFKQLLDGRQRYQEVFTTSKCCAFDEWVSGNINDIYLASDTPIFLENFGADINPYRTPFSLVHFDVAQYKYIFDKINNSIFCWEDGCLLQLYYENGEPKKREFPYIHLQKRKMKDSRINKNVAKYYIIPNKFVDATQEPKKLLNIANIWNLINYQFIFVKAKSLKYRIRNKDWQFTNVFK